MHLFIYLCWFIGKKQHSTGTTITKKSTGSLSRSRLSLLAPSDLNWFRWPSDNPPVRPIIKIKNTHKTQPKKSPLCPTHGDDAPTEKSKRAVARPAATVLPKNSQSFLFMTPDDRRRVSFERVYQDCGRARVSAPTSVSLFKTIKKKQLKNSKIIFFFSSPSIKTN